MSWDFWRVSGAELAHPRPGGVPPAVLWVIRCMNLIFNFLNALWFSKMLKGAIKVSPLLCKAHECCTAGSRGAFKTLSTDLLVLRKPPGCGTCVMSSMRAAVAHIRFLHS